MNGNKAIDAVFTWVDGSDEAHKEKMRPFVKLADKISTKNFRTRFDQVEEIEIAVNSILKFAPFIRKIFIVTDKQIPKFLKHTKNKTKYNKVVIVDHTEIFIGYEEYLPVFNSNSIETMLFKIPDLSEQFIYFNDDFFLINNTKIEDFFIEEKPVVRGVWDQFDSKKIQKIIYDKVLIFLGKEPRSNIFGYKKAQQSSAKVVGMEKYLKLDHTPNPIRKSTVELFFKKNPEALISNISHKFRHPSYFMIQSLANYLEIQNKSCILKNNYQLAYIQSYNKPLLWYKWYLKYCSNNSNKLFMCLQSLDQCSPKKLTYILNWLRKKVSK